MSLDAVDVLMITHNRPMYTKMSLAALLASAEPSTRVWVWHNGTHAPTIEVVESFRDHPNLYKLHFSEVNEKLRIPTNWIFAEGSAPYVAKVDDDCIVTDGWIEKLRQALACTPDLGVVACWHFQTSDFIGDLAAQKTQQLSNGQSLMLNNWVQGSGIMLKRQCIDAVGLIPEIHAAFTPYCEIVRKQGWKLGWLLPLVLIDHMDDPRSVHSRFQTEQDFQDNPPLGAGFGGVKNLEEWKARVHWLARTVQEAPVGDGISAKMYHWRARIRNKAERVLGIDPVWRVAARSRNSEAAG